jgi:3-oxoacyl-[acyl-carrier protein] reductase
MELSGLQGKVVIVTGASRGIGRAVAERLADVCSALVLNHLSDQGAMEQVEQACLHAGAEVVTHRGDIGAPESASRLCDLAVERFGRVDVLVNNAGSVAESLLAASTDEDVNRMVSTNVLGLTWMSRAVLRPMLKQRAGCIVNLSSVLASRPGRGSSVYAGTKGFVESFTRALAVEVGRKNIRVNAVAPGVIETHMTVSARQLAGDSIRERIPMQRFGQPSEVAEVIAFLASDQASYLNGAVLAVDGAFLGGM